jgi:hypothetical protein
MNTQKKRPSNFYILVAMLIAIAIWGTMGPPAMSRNVGSNAEKRTSALEHTTQSASWVYAWRRY